MARTIGRILDNAELAEGDEPKSLGKMTKDELTAYADGLGIQVDGSKADILRAIQAAEVDNAELAEGDDGNA